MGGMAEPSRGALDDRVALGAWVPGKNREVRPCGDRHHCCGAGSGRAVAAVSEPAATDRRELKRINTGHAKRKWPRFSARPFVCAVARSALPVGAYDIRRVIV